MKTQLIIWHNSVTVKFVFGSLFQHPLLEIRVMWSQQVYYVAEFDSIEQG